MPQFAPDQCNFGDVVGYGAFDIAHFREHVQFVNVLAARSPPILIANYDLLNLLTAGGARQEQNGRHYDAHKLLRQVSGITGTDLSGFNLDNQDDFYSFLGYHATEHQQIRQFLGIV